MNESVPLPLQPSDESAPVSADQRQSDANHLRALTIFHYILASLVGLILAFTLWQLISFHWAVRQQGMWMPANVHQQRVDFFAQSEWLGLMVCAPYFLVAALNAASGWCLARRKARTFSLIIAGLDCLLFPFGTVLGVFTLIVLLRGSVSRLYRDASA